jgi:hypothetical protein
LNNAPYNRIGEAGAGNVVAGNAGEGIIVRTNSYGTTIRGNYVGTDAAGAVALGNNIGIFMTSTSSITVGGSNAGEGNLVSGNRNNGISSLNSSYCYIQGNFAGTKAGGTGSLPNAFFGINVNSSSSFYVGGATAETRNIVCYNGAGGINLSSNAQYNNIQGNWIGVDANGDAAGIPPAAFRSTTLPITASAPSRRVRKSYRNNGRLRRCRSVRHQQSNRLQLHRQQ